MTYFQLFSIFITLFLKSGIKKQVKTIERYSQKTLFYIFKKKKTFSVV